jgi:hypothetical protein
VFGSSSIGEGRGGSQELRSSRVCIGRGLRAFAVHGGRQARREEIRRSPVFIRSMNPFRSDLPAEGKHEAL